jgi:hypothetical protein
LPRHYAVHLTKTLAEAIEDSLALSPNEQLNLYEELALMRAVAKDACEVYDLCRTPEQKSEGGVILRSAIKEVIATCEAAARVQAQAKDKLSIHNLSFVLAQVVQCAWKAFGDDIEKVQEFERLIRDTVKMPEAGGTTRTPDQDVVEMDDSVPKE